MDPAIVNTSTSEPEKRRIKEIDYVKALCLLGLIFVHCFEELYEGDGSATSSLFLDYFNVFVGATSFMFCMGFTVDLGKGKSAKDCFKRGIILFTTAFLLEILRDVIPILIALPATGAEFTFKNFIAVLNCDILNFAGLAFLLLALLKKCKAKPWAIFIVAIAISGIGTIFRYTDTGDPVTNALLGFFIGTNAESYFPLCHWFMFVAAGNLFRHYYVKYENKTKFYLTTLIAGAVLSAAYLLLCWNEIMPFQALGEETWYFTWMNPCDAIGCIACVITYVSFMYFIAQLIGKLNLKKFRPLTYLGNNLSVIYIFQWIVISLIEYVLINGYELLPWPETDIAILIYTVIVFVLTIVLVELYKKTCRKAVLRSLQNHIWVWAAVILVITVVCVCLSISYGITEIPSFLNDYEASGISW